MIIHTMVPHEYILPSRYKARKMYAVFESGIPKVFEQKNGSAENIIFSTDPDDYLRFKYTDITIRQADAELRG